MVCGAKRLATGSFMTHEPEVGGFTWQVPGLYALQQGWRSLLKWAPGSCPACGVRVIGGMLCSACTEAAVHDMWHSVPVLAGTCHGVRSEQAQGYRCARCALRLKTLQSCPDCGLLPLAVSRVVAAFDYDDAGKALVSRFKHGRQFLLSRSLAQLMAAEVLRHDDLQASLQSYVLVPVPARKVSVRERGFNPPAELARYLSQALHLPYRPGWLLRQEDGVRQTGQTREERLALTDAGRYDCRALPAGAKVALVDDVMTTGSTLHQAASALRKAGAADVTGIVLARTPLR